MALRMLRYENDEILRKKSKPVKVINQNIHILLDDLLETMRYKDGVGLAAPQVGILKRVVVIEIAEQLYELINPEIVEIDGVQQQNEGCLSIPGRTGMVERPAFVKVKALNRDGEVIYIEGDAFLAVALCHEIDHLDGVLYTDKLIEPQDTEFEDSEVVSPDHLESKDKGEL